MLHQIALTPMARQEGLVERVRRAQGAWSLTPLPRRLAVLRRLRHAIAENAANLVESLARPAGRAAESLVAEIIPLADAIGFLERDARRILRPSRYGRRGRPGWLFRTGLEIRREPLGVVLVIAPRNYPLFIPGVQVVQALAAGNGVIVKPAPGASAPMVRLNALAVASGLPADLFVIAEERPEGIPALLDAGLDKVVVTGSAATGRALLAELAPRLIPATMELSGCDAVFVLAGADLDLVARSLAFGMRFNEGRTCIAPRRVFVHRSSQADLAARVARLMVTVPPVQLEPALAHCAASLVEQAIASGAKRVTGAIRESDMSAVVLTDVRAKMDLAKADVFAPLLSLIPVENDEEALTSNRQCPYALGAAVFGEESSARKLAGGINAGVVVVNDLIVPHADPRVPFGGRDQSGFGTTRGEAGLLEMTRLKVISVRRGRFRPHLDPAQAGDEALFANYLRAAHGAAVWGRVRAGLRLIRSLIGRKSQPGGSK